MHMTTTAEPPAGGRRPSDGGRGNWLGPALLALSVAGLPLSTLALSRLGRAGRLTVQAASTLLFARAVQFVVTGKPARLRTLPRLLAFIELGVDGLAVVAGFWAWVWQPCAARGFGGRPDARAAAPVERLSRLAVAAMFAVHAVRMAIYVSPGRGRRAEAAGQETSPPGGQSAAGEIAADVHCLEVGTGIMRANVYFVRSGSSWALIDTASAHDGESIRQAAESLFGEGTRPAAILLTHSHPDHAGSALELARLWGCPVYVHPDEMPLVAPGDLATVARYANPLDRWLILPVLRALPRRRVEAMFAETGLRDVVRALDPAAEAPGLPGWACVPTPGHTPGHLSFFRSSDRVLIAADAVSTVDLNSFRGMLWWSLRRGRQRVSGPPWYSTWNWRLAKASVAVLARLEPRVLACGHGLPIRGDRTARDLRAFADRFGAAPAVHKPGRVRSVAAARPAQER